MVSAFLAFAVSCKQPASNTSSTTAIAAATLTTTNNSIPGHAITAQQAKTLLDTDKTVVFIDVRDQNMFDSGHIPGAVLIPVIEIKSRLSAIPKDKQVVVYAECN
jgi:predicted sulfurtransferase